jgi:hypothetical protein
VEAPRERTGREVEGVQPAVGVVALEALAEEHPAPGHHRERGQEPETQLAGRGGPPPVTGVEVVRGRRVQIVDHQQQVTGDDRVVAADLRYPPPEGAGAALVREHLLTRLHDHQVRGDRGQRRHRGQRRGAVVVVELVPVPPADGAVSGAVGEVDGVDAALGVSQIGHPAGHRRHRRPRARRRQPRPHPGPVPHARTGEAPRAREVAIRQIRASTRTSHDAHRTHRDRRP